MDTGRMNQISRTAIAARYGVTRNATYLWVEEGTFPAPDIELGTYKGWLVSTILRWEAQNTALLKKRRIDPATLPTLEVAAPAPKQLSKADAKRRSVEIGQSVLSIALAELAVVARNAQEMVTILLTAQAEGRIISQDEQDEIETNVASLVSHYLPSLANWRQLMDAGEKPTAKGK